MLTPGTVLRGRYRVERRLGGGAGGDVWLVRDRLRGDRPLALKRLADAPTPPDAAAHARADAGTEAGGGAPGRGPLRREFAVLATLSHPHLGEVLALERDPESGRDDLLAVWYPAGDLDGWLAAAPAPRRDAALRLAVEVLRALVHLHDRGVVHGDLKPSNVALDGAGHARVIDFGLSRPLRGGPTAEPAGTPAYLAPELLHGAAPGPATDLYAFGVLLHQLLLRRLPFAGDATAQLRARAEGRAVDLDGDAAALGAVAPLLARLLAADPAERPADARTALFALADAAGLPPETPACVLARVEAPRAEALRSLVADLVAQRAGPLVHVIAGPAGSGRTTALRRLHRAALLGGVHAPEPEAPAAAPWLPAWLGLSDVESTPDVEPTQDGRPDALGEALLALAGTRPVLLAVDDLDGAAPSVRALVAWLVRVLADEPAAPLRIVVGLRADRSDDERLGDRFQPYAVPAVTWLAALGREEVAAVLRRTFPGREPASGLVDVLHRTSGGRLALLHEILRRLLVAGALPTDDREPLPEALAPDAAPLPASLEEAAAERLAALGAAERQVLEDVVRLAPPVPRAALEAVVAEVAALLAAGSLVADHGPEGERVDVADAALRELLRDRLRRTPAPRRADDLATRALRAGLGADRVAPLLAEAGRLGDAADTADGLGRRLLDAGAAAEACPWLRQAVGWRERAGAFADVGGRLVLAAAESARGDARAAAACLAPPCAVAEARDRARLALARAGHLVAAGEHGAALEALRGTPSTDAGDEARRAVLAARAHLLRGEHAAASEAARQALAAGGASSEAGDAAATAVRAFTTLGLAAFYAGDYGEAAERLRAARARIEGGAAPEERAFVLSCQGLVLQRQGDLAGAAARYRESADGARLRGDLARVGAATLNLGTVAQETGALDDAIAAFEEAARVGRRLDDRPLLVKANVNLANLHTQVGALDEAERYLVRTRALADAAGLAQFSAYAVLVGAEAALHRGDLAAARARLADADTRFGALGARRERLECVLVAGRVALAASDLPAAREAGARLREAGHAERLPRFAAWGWFLEAEAEWARYGGDRAAALERYQAALRAGGDEARPEDRWRVLRGLAQVFAALGRVEEARTAAREGLALLDAMGRALGPALRRAFEASPERSAAREQLAALAAGGTVESPPTDGGAAVGRARETFFEQILELNKRLASEPDLDRLLATILDVAISLTGAERGFVLLPPGAPAGDPTAAVELRARVARNIDRETLQRKQFKVSASIAREVFLTGRPLLSVDAMEDDRLQAHLSIAALKLRSVLCVPLHHRDRALGVVYIDNRFQRGAFTGEHLRRLEAFADQAALALANAQAREAERQARDELERARGDVERLARRLEDDLSDRTAALAEAETRLRDRQEVLESRYDYANIVGRSPAIRRVFALLDRVTDSDVPVLVLGESGTGKELVARAVHYNGPRRAAELVSLNCAALPETLLEAELFGHVRGAYTGADRDREGFLERAHRGTLFLDEVGDMPLVLQAKLLRVLESGEFARLGDPRTRRVDVRVVAATNRDLPALVRDGRFREDLYYRLHVVAVHLPPLRDREGDLPLLAVHLLARHAEREGRPPQRLAPDALRVLERYAWPGNVRELDSVLTTVALLTDGPTLTAADLLQRPELAAALPADAAPGAARWDGRATLEEIERSVAADAVARFGGNKAKAARALGISRNTLYAKL